MGAIQYPYPNAKCTTSTKLTENLFNIPGDQLEGLTERIGGTWTSSTRPSPSTGVPHPIGWNTDLGVYEYWSGTAWVQLSGGGPGPTPTRIYTCSSGVAVGDWLAKNSMPNTVVFANASSAGTFAFGVCSQKITGTTCVVQRTGELGGFSGLTAGQIYYLDTTNGQMRLAPSPFPTSGIIQKIAIAKNADTIEVAIKDFYEII